MSKNVVYKSPTNPESGQAYTDTVSNYTFASASDNVLTEIPCDASVFVGAIVRMNGSTAVNAIANSEPNSRAIGIVIKKTSSTKCDILMCGFTPTGTVSGPAAGESLFLSDSNAGQITTTPPTTAGHVIVYVGRYYNSGVIRLGSLDRIIRN